MEKIESKDFMAYFKNYASFILKTRDNFKKRFSDVEKLDDNDFELFMNFSFFLTHYDFQYQMKFYSNKWNNTLYQTKEYIEKIMKKASSDNSCKFEINNNT